MIKTLILVRHSKAESRDQSLSDIYRPITEEGKADSYRMANQLLSSGIKPDLIIASVATRASQTASIFSEVLNTGDENINLLKKLYYGSAKTIMDCIFGIPDNINCVIVVAHNPGISELARALSSGRIFYMENTHIIILEYNIEHWRMFDEHKPAGYKSHRVNDTPIN